VKSGRTKIKFIALIVAVTSFFSISVSACTGCFVKGITKFKFKTDLIALTEGETFTLTTANFDYEPLLTADKGFTLTSSDVAVFTVSGKTITAVAEGTAKVTAASEQKPSLTTECTVRVGEPDLNGVRIIADGELYQDADAISNVDFLPDFNYVKIPDREVVWSVSQDGGGVLQNAADAAEKAFSFLPSGVGAYKVTATAKNREDAVFTDETYVRVYNDYITEPALTHTGELTQNEDGYSPITFAAEFTDAPGNPARVIEWLVDGETVGGGASFVFNPGGAGKYKIVLKINGEKIASRDVTIKGRVVPKNLKIDTDNCYPDIMLTFGAAYDDLDYEVEIFVGKEKIHTDSINSKSDATRGLFNGRSVNLARYIGKDNAGVYPNKNIFNTSYRIRARSLAKPGTGFIDSPYSAEIVTDQIPGAAERYLKQPYNGGAKNFYMADESEFVDFMAYLFLWRKNPYGKETVSETVYTAFAVPDPEKIESDAYRMLHFTGLVSLGYEYNPNDNTYKIRIEMYTDSLPSRTTTSLSPTYAAYAGGLNAIRPHINYTSAVRSGLPIESSSKPTVTVTTTEQLYYVVQSGYQPMFPIGADADNNKAYAAYAYAHLILRKIITDEMTDAQKAHAIYDWIMWRVDYDYDMLRLSDNPAEAVKYSSYYLDGVLNASQSAQSYAVCDAMSKAYALMCNMENIDCMRVTGEGLTADQNGNPAWAGHAWNKVKIDGEWYIVDCTWGDVAVPLDNKVYELASHAYLFLTDKEVERTRREDKPNNYPRTSLKIYNWYNEKFEYKGEKYDYYINAGETSARAETERLVEYMADVTDDSQKLYSVAGTPATSDFRGFDIKVSKSLESMFIAWVTNSRGETVPQIPATSPIALKLQALSLSKYYVFPIIDPDSNAFHIYVFLSI
jgi:hypothetical protein